MCGVEQDLCVLVLLLCHLASFCCNVRGIYTAVLVVVSVCNSLYRDLRGVILCYITSQKHCVIDLYHAVAVHVSCQESPLGAVVAAVVVVVVVVVVVSWGAVVTGSRPSTME